VKKTLQVEAMRLEIARVALDERFVTLPAELHLEFFSVALWKR